MTENGDVERDVEGNVKPKGVYAKIAAIQAATGTVEKTGEVNFGSTNYKHFQEHGLLAELKPLFKEHGLAVIPGTDGYEREGNHTTLHFRLTIVDAETGEQHVEAFPNEGVDQADKGFNKAYTGAMKYALQKLFLIPTEKIDDNEGTQEDSTRGKTDNGKPPKPVPEKRAEALYDLWKHSAVDPARLGLWLVQNGSEDVDAGSVDSLAKAISALPSDKADALEAKLREKSKAAA